MFLKFSPILFCILVNFSTSISASKRWKLFDISSLQADLNRIQEEKIIIAFDSWIAGASETVYEGFPPSISLNKNTKVYSQADYLFFIMTFYAEDNSFGYVEEYDFLEHASQLLRRYLLKAKELNIFPEAGEFLMMKIVAFSIATKYGYDECLSLIDLTKYIHAALPGEFTQRNWVEAELEFLKVLDYKVNPILEDYKAPNIFERLTASVREFLDLS